MAFQIADDLLDIVATASGKTPGTDLREGVLTLPALYTLRTGTDSRLIDLVSRPLRDDAEVAEALALLRQSDGLAEARQTLDDYAADAACRAGGAAAVRRPGRAELADPVRRRTHPLAGSTEFVDVQFVKACCMGNAQ